MSKISAAEPSSKTRPSIVPPSTKRSAPPESGEQPVSKQEEWHVEGSAVLGSFESYPGYRLHGASASTLLAKLLAPMGGDELISFGIEHAADELHVLLSFLRTEDGHAIDDEVVINVANALEGKLRVLAEIARRTFAELNAERRAATSTPKGGA